MNISIGVDIGTTQTKAVAFDERAEVIDSAYFSYPLIQEQPGMAEQDQELIFHAVCTVIRQLMNQLPAEGVLDVVSFSSAMHSLILLDAQMIPLTRMITWADTRAAEQAEKLKKSPLGFKIYQQTGTPLHPMTPLAKIKWLQENNPELIERTAYFIGIKEYIFFRLFGQLVTDYSTASGTGYFDIHQFTWAKEVLEYLNIKENQLPKLAPSTMKMKHLRSDIKQSLGFKNDISFILGGADGPLSNLGLGAFGEDIGALTVGTSGAIRFITDHPQLHPDMETFCYVLDQEHWVVGGATSNGAGIFDWASQTLMQEVTQQAISQGENPYDALLSAIAFVPPGANGLLFQPYLLGERAPLWDAEASGSFLGLQRHHTEKEMMRAILEGICLNLKRILNGICQEGQLSELRATGGFAQSYVFRQLMADVLGYPLVFPTVSEASALGAVFLGWQSLGKIQELNEGRQWIKLDTQVPVQKNIHEIYEIIYPTFVATQQQLSATYPQLAELRKRLAKKK